MGIGLAVLKVSVQEYYNVWIKYSALVFYLLDQGVVSMRERELMKGIGNTSCSNTTTQIVHNLLTALCDGDIIRKGRKVECLCDDLAVGSWMAWLVLDSEDSKMDTPVRDISPCFV